MVEFSRNVERSRYEVTVDGKLAGFVMYGTEGDSVLMPHTEINEHYGGEGLGMRLVQYALDDVRTAGKHVIPMCPFVAAYIRHHPAYLDLVDPSKRAMFKL